MVTTTDKDQIWNVLHTVLDPEVPVLSVVDLGIVRNVEFNNDQWIISICPTYSGCPALDVIAIDIHNALNEADFPNKVQYVLDEAWTSDWITEQGKQKLNEYGISPPVGNSDLDIEEKVIPCPLCQSTNTKVVSPFGSTACKAMIKCLECKEPFEYFKCK